MVIHALLIFTGVGMLLAVLPSNSARLAALGVLIAVGLVQVFRASRALIRQGNQVEVTRGRFFGRSGLVVDVVSSGSCYEVELSESLVRGEMIPSETARFNWFELEKRR